MFGDDQNPYTRGTWQRGTEHQRGADNNAAKLTAEQVIAIRVSVEPTASLATLYGVSMTTVQRIRAGTIWRHV